MLSTVPYGAHSQDTGEYMLGDVVVTVVLFESNGTIQPSTEDWNELVRDDNGDPIFDNQGRTISVSGPNRIEETKDTVREGLSWWEDTLANFGSWQDAPLPTPVHSLNFIYDFEFAHNPVDTGYEPIAGRSNDFVYWVENFLQEAGYATSASRDIDIREFNNAQRVKYDADWAFTIFVANDENDVDGRFASGGSFQYAFAYSGGRFFVAPASRPAASFTHETTHMFWARDEYQYSGASYTDQRGYYNSQNWNAWDNPYLDERQDSLMDGGTSFWTAYDGHLSSESSLAMIGWQDTDGDGVFDVLDVPLTLTGTGYYDSATASYRFVGHSAVQTLINENPSGLQNDITINEVSLAEYSLDGGKNWTVAEQYGTYEADLDLTIPVELGDDVLIRTRSVDPGTGQTVVISNVEFSGSTELPTWAATPGIHGFAWYDEDGDGVWDTDESGIPDWTIQLIDDLGQPIDLGQSLEPDDYANQEVVNGVLDGVTLTAIGYGVKDDRVGSLEATTASTGDQVFGYVTWGTTDTWSADWYGESRQLRIDFEEPVTALSIEAVARNSDGYGRLEIYNADGVLLDRYTTGLLQGSDTETMSLSRPTAEISYAIALSHMGSKIRLDNLQVGPDSSSVTDAQGAYLLSNLPAGTYRVQAVPSAVWDVTQPQTAIREITVLSDGYIQAEPASERTTDFGGQLVPSEYPFQNPLIHADVDDNGAVLPRDALFIINELNRNGIRELSLADGDPAPPPYYDVSGDNLLTPYDALMVINQLNKLNGGSGEPTSGDDLGGGDPGGDNGDPEGEMPPDGFSQLDGTVNRERTVPFVSNVDLTLLTSSLDSTVSTKSNPLVAGPSMNDVDVNAQSDDGQDTQGEYFGPTIPSYLVSSVERLFGDSPSRSSVSAEYQDLSLERVLDDLVFDLVPSKNR